MKLLDKFLVTVMAILVLLLLWSMFCLPPTVQSEPFASENLFAYPALLASAFATYLFLKRHGGAA